jgi:hypothetical protein
MGREAHRDLLFEVPDEWEDKSITAFSSPGEPGSPIQRSVVVTREPLPKGTSLRTFAGRQMTNVGKALPGFQLQGSRDETVGGRPAVTYDFSWEGDSGPLAQRQVLVLVDEQIYCITYSLHRAEVQKAMPAFERLLSTVTFS